MKLDGFREKIRSMVADDLKAIESDGKPQPTTIYHYTDVKGTLGILETGDLWFTERTHLNDTAEMTYGFRIARKLFDGSAKLRKPSVPDIESFRLHETHEMRLHQFGHWIFSASLNDNDLGQWQRYADDGRGVCLGFSLEKLKPTLEPSAITKALPHVHHALRFRVSYSENQLRTNLQRYVDCALDILEKLDLPPKDRETQNVEQEVFFYLNGGIYLHSMLCKHEAYKHEEEYRLLVSGERDKFEYYDCHCVRERNHEMVGYLKLPIPEWRSPGMQTGPLTHVRIGPAAPERLKDQIWTALRSFRIPLLGLNPDKSDLPYRSS